MKVLHLSSERTWRGGEQQIAYLIEELDKSGVQSHIAVRKNSAFEKWCKEKQRDYVAFGFANDFDFSSAFALKKYCRRIRFDLIHLHTSRSHGIAFLAALLGNNVPMIVSRRVDFPIKNNFLTRAKYNHSLIKNIVCVSDKIREIISRQVKHPERCITVYSGIDLNRFAGKGRKGMIRNKYRIQPGEFLIGNIAALAPHKDYFTFLKTAAILVQSHPVKFIIAGDGPLKKEIENEIIRLGLSGKVFLTGFIKELEDVYTDLDVLLFTSKEEGLGTSLLDAMAFGVPIVATAAGGVPEIVIDKTSGLLAPVGDSDALAAKVVLLMNDNQLRNNLVNSAKDFVRNFSKETMASNTIEIYSSIIKSSNHQIIKSN